MNKISGIIVVVFFGLLGLMLLVAVINVLPEIFIIIAIMGAFFIIAKMIGFFQKIFKE